MSPALVLGVLVASAGLQDGVDWDDVLYVALLIVAVAGAVTALWKAGRAAFLCIHQIQVNTAAIRAELHPSEGPSLVEQFAALRTEVTALRAELRPNGGSSLRDQTNRIERTQERIVTRVDAVAQDVADVKAETDRQGARLDLHIDKHGGAG